jgi:serine phosphatase RsbU (regulator of sigma subunit)/DNA-binding response OmpR family regulator
MLNLSPELNPRVLIIDDSPENRYVVRRALTRAGMEVIEAGTGAEGTALAAQRPSEIDLVILDVNLPDTTGFELCRHFKSDPATAHVPVIHLSQSAVDDGSRVRGLEGGADAYLTDPIHGSVLVATVRALLRMRQAEDELRRQNEEADRVVRLNSRLAAASTEAEVVAALLQTLSDSQTVLRAHLFGARPWRARPVRVYAADGEVSAAPLPAGPARLTDLVRPLFHPDTPVDARFVYEDAGGAGASAWVMLPLIAYGREMGTLLIEFAPGVELSPRARGRLSVGAERTAQALERARLFEEQRAIAADLQASLLPAKLPHVPGLSIAAHYRAGAEGMVVGGDFYDVFSGAGGWGMIIGDVCGRGAAAAARTSLARHTAREAARHDRDPATVLAALESAIQADQREALDLISAICLSATPVPGGIELCCAVAGHPLPILVRADGEASQVAEPGPILGINPAARFTSHELFMASGDVLFLYTDGVTESRRSGVLFGEERLAEMVSELVRRGAGVQEMASAPVAAAAAYNEIHNDDMATLVLRAEADPGPAPSAEGSTA